MRFAFKRRGEAGSSLVLALVFLAVVGTIVGSLMFGIGNDLSNASILKSARTLNYAASGAANVAAWNGRFTYTSGTGVCPGVPIDSSGDSSIQINGEWIAVWCKTTPNQPNPLTFQVNREYQIWACLTAPTVSTASTQSSCSADPALYAEVYFNDYSTSLGVDNCTSSSVTTTCGIGMTVAKWIVKNE